MKPLFGDPPHSPLKIKKEIKQLKTQTNHPHLPIKVRPAGSPVSHFGILAGRFLYVQWWRCTLEGADICRSGVMVRVISPLFNGRKYMGTWGYNPAYRCHLLCDFGDSGVPPISQGCFFQGSLQYQLKQCTIIKGNPSK